MFLKSMLRGLKMLSFITVVGFLTISLVNGAIARTITAQMDKQALKSDDQGPARGKRLVRPEDILLDKNNDMVLHGIKVRKGTIGAYMQNAQVFSSPNSSEHEKAAARKLLVEYAPDILALEFDQGIQWKNAEIEKIIETARKDFNAGQASKNSKASKASEEDKNASIVKSLTGEHKTVRPSEVLNDKENYVMINGIKARKGTIAAFSINARTFSKPVNAAEKEAARKLLIELAPGVAAFNVDKVVSFKDPEVQKILEKGRAEVEQKLSRN